MSRAPKSSANDAPQMPRELDADQARRLIEAASDVALVLDGSGLVLDVFSHDLELQKAMRREWRGRTWSDTVTIESRDKVKALLKAL